MEDSSNLQHISLPLGKVVLHTALQRLLQMQKAEDEEINAAYCGSQYESFIQTHFKLLPHRPKEEPYGALAAFNGFNIYLDTELPTDVIEFRNRAGKALYAATLNRGLPVKGF